MTIKLYISAVFLALALLSYLFLRIITEKHRKDPDFVRRMEERELEYKRQLAEEEELERSLCTYDDGEEEDFYDD